MYDFHHNKYLLGTTFFCLGTFTTFYAHTRTSHRIVVLVSRNTHRGPTRSTDHQFLNTARLVLPACTFKEKGAFLISMKKWSKDIKRVRSGLLQCWRRLTSSEGQCNFHSPVQVLSTLWHCHNERITQYCHLALSL